MRKNMGLADRNIRLLLVVSISILYFLNVISGILAVALLLIIGILLVTSITQICPLYLLLRINTQKKLEQ